MSYCQGGLDPQFLKAKGIEHLPRADWPSAYVLWRSVYADPLPIYRCVVRSLGVDMSWMQVPHYNYALQTLSPTLCLPLRSLSVGLIQVKK